MEFSIATNESVFVVVAVVFTFGSAATVAFRHGKTEQRKQEKNDTDFQGFASILLVCLLNLLGQSSLFTLGQNGVLLNRF